MRPFRTYWHWFLGMAILSIPMLFFPAIYLRLGRVAGMAVIEKTAPVLAGVIPGIGLAWFGWVCPLIEFRYLRDWRPTIPRARQSMIFMIYFPAVIFAFLIHFIYWASILLERLVHQYQRFDLTAGKWAWMASTLAVLILAAGYHRWYNRRYRLRCSAQCLCPVCGYDLRVNPAGPCPECGAAPAADGLTPSPQVLPDKLS